MVTLTFERGDPERPVGHTFLYFESGAEIIATYLVVSPVPFDFARYVPPLLASSLGSAGLVGQASFFPIPPVPERYDLAELRRLAELRGDDVLVDQGAVSAEPATLISRVAEIGEAYAKAYEAGLSRAPEPVRAERRTPSDQYEGMALLYSVLSERERIEEIARRLGTVRYAVDGGDAAQVDATCAEMRAIAAYLPPKYRAKELIEAARRPGATGARLAQLYVERGYKISGADEEGIPALEAEIESLERRYA
ncbi:MAG TPA: hypothetical protein VFC51_08980 [Chloroflexota bacterium]|nr:hypothetical protein [Chloroflexota bacterium]